MERTKKVHGASTGAPQNVLMSSQGYTREFSRRVPEGCTLGNVPREASGLSPGRLFRDTSGRPSGISLG